MSKLREQLTSIIVGEAYAGELLQSNFCPGTFLWALDQAMQGKEVKRASWAFTWKLTACSKHDLYTEDFTATDWELYEEWASLEEVAEFCKSTPLKTEQLAAYGGDAVEHLRWNDEAWALVRKDRALEMLYFRRNTAKIGESFVGRSIESSEGMYHMKIGDIVYAPTNSTDEEWEKAVKEQVEEFRKKHDPGYYCGDAGDEDDGERATWWSIPSGEQVGIGGPPPPEAKKEAKCECGSEKAKVPGHSTWCPKYKKEESE